MTPRRIALGVLNDVCDRGAYANLTLKKAAAGLSGRDAQWLFALVYTTLDHILTIDYYLSHYLRTPRPEVMGILRLGVCELLYMHTPPHAAIFENAALCRQIGRHGLTGLVNAVLRRIDRERDSLPPLPADPLRRLSLCYSYPEWLVSEWMETYGPAFTEGMLSAAPAPMELRAQYPADTTALIGELPVPVRRGALDENCLQLEAGLDVAKLPAFLEGRLAVQSQSAMLCCRAIADCRGRRVLDACAAPGGKSAYLASLCENDLELFCWELHAHRKTLLDGTLERLRVEARSALRDAAVHDPAFDGAFDFVLLDAPCSGLGQTHDKPDIRYARTDADIAALAALQSRLLAACAPYVRPGGVLLYATCTISRRENEAQIRAFLSAHEAFSLERMPLPVDNEGMLQLFPHVHETDGFFMARCRRCI
ncbi:MAG: 16S rRNA (cytosine(967)-C(5))-methyltransferase RsmB [Clostridia bacterium]|nr:16S rRNA (cytosine(967)-C(5))-methyltransferase RsmB [Clostridia bacterium]